MSVSLKDKFRTVKTLSDKMSQILFQASIFVAYGIWLQLLFVLVCYYFSLSQINSLFVHTVCTVIVTEVTIAIFVVEIIKIML